VLSDFLFAIDLVAYVWLCLLTALRIARSRSAIWADLMAPNRVFLFFTAVAATDVLGMPIGLRGFATVALVMWLVAFALWFVLIYIGFGVMMIRNTPDDADVVAGAWLNAIVGTQSRGRMKKGDKKPRRKGN
jgi:tellurite resistance protein TehA-like permease